MNKTSTSNLQLPIGVFDSGVGGLSVLRALQQFLPHESFLYLGDTARLPYGTKSPETVARYAKQASKILIQRGIKLLVIACSTASALALSTLQESFPGIPIIGVLEPSAKAACSASHTGHIAVIATEATVSAGSYQAAIQKIRPDAAVIAQSCSLFVALAEEGWIDGPIAEAVAKRYLDPLFVQPHLALDCLILGCTHFPALMHTIKKIIGDQINIIDSGQVTAQLVAQTLQQLSLSNSQSTIPITQFLVTDAPNRFAKIARYFLDIELNIQNIELVDFAQAEVLPQGDIQDEFNFPKE